MLISWGIMSLARQLTLYKLHNLAWIIHTPCKLDAKRSPWVSTYETVHGAHFVSGANHEVKCLFFNWLRVNFLFRFTDLLLNRMSMHQRLYPNAHFKPRNVLTCRKISLLKRYFRCWNLLTITSCCYSTYQQNPCRNRTWMVLQMVSTQYQRYLLRR